MHSRKSIFSYSIIFMLTLILTACGGSENKASITPSVSEEPIQITDSSWNNYQSKSLKSIGFVTEFKKQSSWLFSTTLKGVDVKSKHWQILLDTDNDPKTGFQFDNEAWSMRSGVDYLIEDGYLYKSTANDSSWSWQKQNRNPYAFTDANGLSLSLPAEVFKGLCKEFNAGFISLDDNWSIETFFPQANSMLKQTTNYCNKPIINTYPTITLNGLNPIVVALNKSFVDPGATATDLEDGDISSSVEVVYSNINTSKAGNYYINYKVTDSGGLFVTKRRFVIVKEKPSTGIVINGNNDDWSDIEPLAMNQSGTLKVTDNIDTLFIMIQGTASTLDGNRQVFIDSDNNDKSGFLISGAANYLIENEDFNTFIGTRQEQWAWNYNSAEIISARVANILEIAIPKSAFNYLSNTPAFSYHNLDYDWNTDYMLPATLIKYTLKYPFKPKNKVPKAITDNVTVKSSTSITINVLKNDSDPDGDTLSITKVASPLKGGKATISGKRIKYVSKSGFLGADSFSYTITDGKGHTATAMVNVNVTTNNKAPTAVNDQSVTTNRSTIVIDALNNDSDPDGDTLTITKISSPATGTAIIRNNKIDYSPKAQFVGVDSLTYTISDGKGHTATATATITVTHSNLRPKAVNDRASTNNRTSIIIDALKNDSDPDDDALTIIKTSSPKKGTASIINNKISYIPKANYVGTDSFTYSITDGTHKAVTATVTITVIASINQRPDAVEDAPSTNHTIPVVINVLQNDTDGDGDTLTVTSITQPPEGTTKLNANGTVTFDPKGHVGSHSFSYTISDGHGGTDSTIVTIATSDPTAGHDSYPDITNEVVNTPKNTPIFIDVLANDSDADGDTLILDQVDSGSHGTTVKVNGGVLYTPEAGYTGTDEFYYGVHDGYGHNGAGHVSITIIP